MEALRSFTNSDGMSVEVSKEHLDKAVAIKLELQNESPSRRCNWKRHKILMEKEGFFESDITESYRCLIKDYQKQNGLLLSVSSHADMVATSKLESIREVVGEIYYAKRENQLVLRDINKIKRDLSLTGILAEEYRNLLLDEITFDVPHYVFQPRLANSKNQGVVVITDWHIGVTVNDCSGNYYNLEIAKKRVDKLLKETLEYCKLFNINTLHVACLGDMVEHLYMRKNQSQECEFGLSRQMAEAKRLIWKFIVNLSEYVNVVYAGIAGNHDRMDGDKTASFDGDNAMFTINEGIKDNIDLLGSNRIEFLDLDPHAYHFVLELNGKKLKFAHGDRDNGNKKNKLNQHISMDRDFYDAFIYGHLHNFAVGESDHGAITVGVGCMQGRNNYSKLIGCATDASQAFILIKEDGDILPLRIGLQII